MGLLQPPDVSRRRMLLAVTPATINGGTMLGSRGSLNVSLSREMGSGIGYRSEELREESRSVEENSNRREHAQRGRKWEKPLTPAIKVNVDAALHPDGSGCVAGVIRDSQGKFLAATSKSIYHISESVYIEALAAVEGATLAKGCDAAEAWVEGDAKAVIDALNSAEANAPDLHGIAGRVGSECNFFYRVRLVWAP